MRILVLSKRQYTGKDLLDDRYGRLFEIPAELARRGHQIQGIAMSYRPRKAGVYIWEDVPDMCWASFNALSLSIVNYSRDLGEVITRFHPDLIWACSDAIHAIIGWRMSVRHRIPFVVDLYDNFDSFLASRLPGLPQVFHAACRGAKGLTVVSEALRQHVIARYGISVPCKVIGNGILRSLFFPRERLSARARLGLPAGAQLIGTAGAITSNRGVEDLFRAFLQLAANNDQLFLVFAGPRDSTPSIYPHDRVIDLGILPYADVPYLFSALDVVVICNRDSAFGRYCFPQKLYEAIACGTPVVAAGVGDVARLFAPWPDCLYPPGNAGALAERLEYQLCRASPLAREGIPTWGDWARLVEGLFVSVLSQPDATDRK